jgi:Helix-turn-helix.
MDFSAQDTREAPAPPKRPGRTPLLTIPINPLLYASLRAIYAGGANIKWSTDLFGRPYYDYHARDGRITLYYDLPVTGYLPWNPPPKGLPTFHRHFLGPRWGFIYSGRLRASLKNLSVETADVLLILMAKIARLQDAKRDIARICLEEIADSRGVRLRHGKTGDLHEALKAEVLRLADFRVSMVWRDYKNRRDLSWGKERPDSLLDIVDIECRRSRQRVTSFSFRCSQAMAHFLDPRGLRWIGYYSKALLNLSPYHEAFTKKIGTYWIMVGITAGKKGAYPLALPKTILDFCGEDVNWRNPGRTVDAFIKAHERLEEIGVLEAIPALEPLTRQKGYFEEWMNTPLSVGLSGKLWKVNRPENKRAPSGKPPAARQDPRKSPSALSAMPASPREIQSNPAVIRSFRQSYGFNQEELARALKVSRQTLSKYERGIHAIPDDKAADILKMWNTKARFTG